MYICEHLCVHVGTYVDSAEGPGSEVLAVSLPTSWPAGFLLYFPFLFQISYICSIVFIATHVHMCLQFVCLSLILDAPVSISLSAWKIKHSYTVA